MVLAALASLGDKGKLGPQCRSEYVHDLERRLEVRFPESYRSFVLQVGDGGAGPGRGLWPLSRAARWADRGVYAPGYLATPFPFTARVPYEHFSELDDYGHHDDALTGSMIIGEIGTHTYFRLVVTGPARGQVWRDEVAANGDLIPGLDFADWYLNWLRRLGALKGSQTGRRRLV